MIKPTTQEHDNIACARPSLENVQRNSQAVHVYLLRLACLHSLPLLHFTQLLHAIANFCSTRSMDHKSAHITDLAKYVINCYVQSLSVLTAIFQVNLG